MTQPGTPATTDLAPKINRAFDFAGAQLRRLIETHPDYFPMYTQAGKWRHGGDTWTNWCEGFLGGQLWLLYHRTRDPYWRAKAEHYSRLIEHRKTDWDVHDLGFLFWSTWKRWYDLEGDPAVNAVVVEAGRTLSLRFKEKGQYLRSFVADDSLFIDIMMNVGIIFYAAQQTGDAELLRRATQHALTTRRCLVRGDGSASHEGIFDLNTGEFLRQTTQQGWRDDSSWARGLTWALYGFGAVYGFTGDERFLRTAQACADFYIERTPAHGVPPNDWEEPNPALPYESSAAAIAASGLLSLAALTRDTAQAAGYRACALRILNTLTEPEFLAIDTPGWEGILKHGMYHQRRGLGVDESVMWGDYFFLEALDKAAGAA
ncbi:MAG: glycoside hydrolase family 88 protein [Chloroflexi bacterium]|nr:glycoside hydrolase family 88 protein [Chloroflexota bacterium]MCL5275385.1 glycoside hydrolase family 88 protein [Chloroflexota bacterium]